MTVLIDSNKGNRVLCETKRDGEGVHFRLELDRVGSRLTPTYAWNITRALKKIALGLAYLDHGTDAFGPRFDPLRKTVFGEPHDGYLDHHFGMPVLFGSVAAKSRRL